MVDNHKNFISNLVDDILLNKKLSYFGGENLFNNIYHIDSLTKVIKRISNKGINKNYEIINIGSNNPIKINQVVRYLGGKIIKNTSNTSLLKKNMFTININKLNNYYKTKHSTKYFLKKYLKERQNKK